MSRLLPNCPPSAMAPRFYRRLLGRRILKVRESLDKYTDPVQEHPYLLVGLSEKPNIGLFV